VAIALYATIRHMKESRDETATGSFDWLGAFVARSRSAGWRSGRRGASRRTGRTRSPGSR
jgi:hypothetical protein